MNLFVSQNEPSEACAQCKVGDRAPEYKSAGVTAPVFINVGGGTTAPGEGWGKGAAVYQTVKSLAEYMHKGSWDMEYAHFCNEPGQRTKQIDLTNFVGICYDIERSGVDWDSLEESLKLVKKAGLQTIVTVAHTGTDVTADTMDKIIASGDIDILSPQLYAEDGCGLSETPNPSSIPWAKFNAFKGQFIPSVGYSQLNQPIELEGYTKKIDARILWPGTACNSPQVCPPAASADETVTNEQAAS